MSEAIFSKINEMIVQNQGISPNKITLDTAFDQLGMDSLDALALINDLEEEFGVSIPNEEILQIKTIRQAVESLTKAVGR